MNHDCGAMAVEHDCCAAKPSSLVGLLSSTPISVLAPPTLVAVSVTAIAPAALALLSTSSAFDSHTPKSSRRPTYLLVSVFRI